jgi:hypothetical protein
MASASRALSEPLGVVVAPLGHVEHEPASSEMSEQIMELLHNVPVPDDAPPMDSEHREFGEPHKDWPYHDARS